MARKLNQIVCPKCRKLGGVLNRRQAGNGKRHKYFYISHYAASSKSKKIQCYISNNELAYIKINNKYFQKYKEVLSDILDRSKDLDLLNRSDNLLKLAGFPKRFTSYKVSADVKGMQALQSIQDREKTDSPVDTQVVFRRVNRQLSIWFIKYDQMNKEIDRIEHTFDK